MDCVDERHRHRFEVQTKTNLISLPSTLKCFGNILGYCNTTSSGLFSFKVNPVLKGDLEKNGLQFVGQDEKGERMEVIELEGK